MSWVTRSRHPRVTARLPHVYRTFTFCKGTVVKKKIWRTQANSDRIHLETAGGEVCKFAVTKLESFFAPLQMGIATAGGYEAAVHAARSFITGMPRDQVFVKLDFAKAFNILQRDVMLQAVYNTIPELYAFIHQAYSAESLLQFGPFVVHSQLGPQQVDPLGPLLFCLPLHSTLQSMRSRLRLGYLNHISLGGKVEDVQHDLTKVKELEL